MIRLRRAGFFGGLLLAAALITACESQQRELRVVAPSLTLDSEILVSLESLLEKNSDYRLDITSEAHAGEIALDMLVAGEADMALVSNYLPYREGVATVMPMYASILHIAYREGRDDSSFVSLLTGARIFAGAEGSASRMMFDSISGRLKDQLELTEGPWSYDETLDIDNPPDILGLFAPISRDRTEALDGYRLYSFGTPADIGAGSFIDTAAMLNPPLRPFVIPASTYGQANTGPVLTVAVDKMLVVRSDLEPSVVYDLIRTIRRLRPAMSAERPGLFEKLGESIDVSESTFVLHEGTQRFLHREEPTIYERYSGVAEVVVTLMVTLISAGFAGFRILKLRRKNRIDRFYSAAIDIRNSISESSSDDDRLAAVQKVKELQDDAFDQLVNEKLSADESFRIFITLSNDIVEGVRPASR